VKICKEVQNQVFKRNKPKLENKESGLIVETKSQSTSAKKHEGFSQFFKIKSENKQEKSANVPRDSDFLNYDRIEKPTEGSPTEDKIATLIKKIRESEEKLVAPKLDLMNCQITFPLLREINEIDSNINFLENLTTPSVDILEKLVYERLATCPQHPKSFNVTVRLYCPKCNSMEIEKLHLYEHKICGYISEKKNFCVSENDTIEKCPSCNKVIKDSKKELRIPAMWYDCLGCNEKFDNVTIKLHCRKFNHDFETNLARTISIPGFKLKHSKLNYDLDSILISKLKDLLKQHGYLSEENHSLKGKSGQYHNIDLISTKGNTETIFTFIFNSENQIEESEINAKVIEVLDCTPTKTVIIGPLSEESKSIASQYEMIIIDSLDPENVLSSFSRLLTGELETENAKSKNLESEKLDAERLEIEGLEAEKLEAEKLEAEKLEAEKLEAEKLEAARKRLEEERNELDRIEAERQVERKRLQEERKKVERLEAERVAERKKLEEERLAERKKLEEERLAERKKLEEERKKVERLEAEQKRLEEERKNVERLEAERKESERKRLEIEQKEAEKREKILKELEETEKQLKSLKSSFDSAFTDEE